MTADSAGAAQASASVERRRIIHFAPAALLIVALLALLLPFTTISLNAAAMESTLSVLGPLTDAEKACLQARVDQNAIVYSGVALLINADPSENSSNPPECASLGGQNATGSAASGTSGYAAGFQPLLAAVIALFLISGVLSLMRSPYRGAVVAPLVLLALMLLIAEQFVAGAAVTNRLPAGSQSLVDVHADIGFVALMVCASTVALVSAVSFLLGQRRGLLSRPS